MRTVQLELERALAVFFRAPLRVTLSGRTDTGVHAKGQVAHFDVADFDGDFWRLLWGLNGILAQDISVVKAQIVPDDFHARFSAVEREYVYRILNRPQRSALYHDSHYFLPLPLDIGLMSSCAGRIVGTHDFSSFKSSNSDRTSATCHVSRAELLNFGEGELEFWIAANHFVYNMVRILVGTLIEIGLGKRTPEGFVEALHGANRNLSGPTAPPWGLTLNSVKYPDVYRLFQEGSQEDRRRSKKRAQIPIEESTTEKR